MNTIRQRRAQAGAVRARRLGLELLEERRVLSAVAPWHNHAVPLDVNNDGHIFPSDALAIVNRLLLVGISQLGEPNGEPEFYYDTNADGMLSPLDLVRVFNGLLRPTEVVLDTLMPFTIDLTPRLQVYVADGVSVPDGTPVYVDVDLNNDGQFTGDELNYTVSSMHRGRSEFALGPALPANDGPETYSINLRARVQNSAGVLTPTAVQPMIVDTQMSDALASYVNTPDPSYTWSVEHQSMGPGNAYAYFVVKMTSQTWRDGDVNIPVWDHWVKIVVPQGVTLSQTAVLLITGGSNTSSLPTSPDASMVTTALATNSVTVELRIVPNEPVIFFDEQPTRSRTEDEIIAYTYDQYLNNIGEPGNETWPLLLPMVKSAVRAMDTVQQLATLGGIAINDFIVTGYSKRGWTTWLTTAVDDRIIASIPGVFDNPNQGPSMVHHFQVLGQFSEQVADYSEMQIFERLMTPEAQLLSQIVDPYRYLGNGRFDDMPMLILNSAGDEFFMPDSSQYYFADLPGDDKYMRYLANTGHGLDVRAVESTITFTDAVINQRELPDFTWTVEPNGEIHVHTIDTPTQVVVWQATNPFARDFRRGYNPWITWTSSEINDLGGGNYVGSVPYPATGATAFFVELTFPSGIDEVPHVFTTDIRVNSDLPRTPFPYSADAQSLLVGAALAAPAQAELLALDEKTLLVPLFALPSAIAPMLDIDPLLLMEMPPDGTLAAAIPTSPATNAASWEDDDERSLPGLAGATTGAFDLALDAALDEILG